MHEEMRSKARITLILVLAKWQLEDYVTLLITKLEGLLFKSVPILTFRSERNFSPSSLYLLPPIH